MFRRFFNLFRKKKKETHMKGAWRYKKDGITKEFLD